VASHRAVNLNLATSLGKNSVAAKITTEILNFSLYGSSVYLKKRRIINSLLNARRVNFFKKRSYSKLKYFFNQKIKRGIQLKGKHWGSNYDKSKKFMSLSYAKVFKSQSMLLFNLSPIKFDNISLSLTSNVIKSSLRQNSLTKKRDDTLKLTQLSKFRPKLLDYLDKSLIDFIMFTAGSKAIVQFYPFLANSNISQQRISFYKN